jgi:hypothetical protein
VSPLTPRRDRRSHGGANLDPRFSTGDDLLSWEYSAGTAGRRAGLVQNSQAAPSPSASSSCGSGPVTMMGPSASSQFCLAGTAARRGCTRRHTRFRLLWPGPVRPLASAMAGRGRRGAPEAALGAPRSTFHTLSIPSLSLVGRFVGVLGGMTPLNHCSTEVADTWNPEVDEGRPVPVGAVLRRVERHRGRLSGEELSEATFPSVRIPVCRHRTRGLGQAHRAPPGRQTRAPAQPTDDTRYGPSNTVDLAADL